MSAPRVCVIFNNVDDRSSIGALCKWSVETALGAGWEVSVIARDLDKSLTEAVEWTPLHVPARVHAYQWYAALPTVRKAMAGRRWDVVHVQQPQLTSIADVLHLHYLVGVARELTPRTPVTGARAGFGRLQARLTELGENWQLGHLPSNVELMPVSGFLRDEVARRYPRHDRVTVLPSPAPELVHILPGERAGARQRLAGDTDGPVVGFLGGADPRKGGDRLMADLASTFSGTVLLGGSGQPAAPNPGSATVRVVNVGYVQDTREFYAACDVFVAAAWFDPGPLTAVEAAAHGVPVVGTSGCGVVREMAEGGAALLVGTDGDLAQAVLAAHRDRERLSRNGHTFVGRRTRALQGKALLDVYESVLARRTGR